MSTFHEITPEAFSGNPFEMINHQWMLVTSGNREKCNTMTASWGGMGILWHKNVAYVFLRPQRYTKEFVDREKRLSLSFLPEQYRPALSCLGKVSGRDEDKMAKSGLTVAFDNDTPYFAEADTVFICRAMYAQELSKDCLLEDWIDPRHYPAHDYHTMYVCDIEKILKKD